MGGSLTVCGSQGEPHLSTAHAVMMSYWDGVVHFVLFLTIIRRMFSG